MTVAGIIALLVVGILLLLAELVVIPGFGIAGILGLAALIGGAGAAWIELGPNWGMAAAGVSVVVSGLLVYIVPKTRAGRKLVLEHEQKDAYSQTERSDLVGQTGTAVTPLRPTGRVRFGHEEVDVVTDGEYIDNGSEVQVVAVEGTRVVVVAIDAGS